MAIYRLLQNSTLEPETVSRITEAYERALHTLANWCPTNWKSGKAAALRRTLFLTGREVGAVYLIGISTSPPAQNPCKRAGTSALTHSTDAVVSPIRKQAADALRRARKLPAGPHRNGLRQLAMGRRWFKKQGFEAATRNHVAGLQFFRIGLSWRGLRWLKGRKSSGPNLI